MTNVFWLSPLSAGDLVRLKDAIDGPIMEMESAYVDNKQDVNTLPSHIWCRWNTESEEFRQVFSIKDLEIVLRRKRFISSPMVLHEITASGASETSEDYRRHYSAKFGSNGFLTSHAAEFIFDDIDKYIDHLGIRPAAKGRYDSVKNVIQGYFSGKIEVSQKELLWAQVDLLQIRAIVETSRHETKLPDSLRRALYEDPLIPSADKPSPGRNLLFEHFIAAKFKGAGCTVHQEEPDWRCYFSPICFTVAVKRASLAQLEKRIREARDQILRHPEMGIIVIDITKNDATNMGEVFEGSAEEYRNHVHKWIGEHAALPLLRNQLQWKLFREKIPAVIFFHMGVGFVQGVPLVLPHFSLIRIGTPPTKWGRYNGLIIDELIESFHLSHPENGVIRVRDRRETWEFIAPNKARYYDTNSWDFAPTYLSFWQVSIAHRIIATGNRSLQPS
jgi:hypothetical protein